MLLYRFRDIDNYHHNNSLKVSRTGPQLMLQAYKLDRRTKQHTQFGVSTSNGSRDMARTKLWRKKEKKKKK